MPEQALAGHLSKATGMDISGKMVDEYKTRLADLAPTTPQGAPLPINTHVGDLLAEELSPELPRVEGFDLAAVGLGFHHFDNFPRAVARLAACLKPGGTLLILDFTEEGDRLDPAPGVTAQGFSEQMMVGLFEQAGLQDAAYTLMDGHAELMHHGKAGRKKVFLARGRKV
jgi:SAM-dependent methyltransferase